MVKIKHFVLGKTEIIVLSQLEACIHMKRDIEVEKLKAEL
jgi:hypothetical protein